MNIPDVDTLSGKNKNKRKALDITNGLKVFEYGVESQWSEGHFLFWAINIKISLKIKTK